MKKPSNEVLALLRSDEGWISVEEIADVIEHGVCLHGLPRIDACGTCMPTELTRRQMAHLARKLGCSEQDARAVADKLVHDHIRRLEQQP